MARRTFQNGLGQMANSCVRLVGDQAVKHAVQQTSSLAGGAISVRHLQHVGMNEQPPWGVKGVAMPQIRDIMTGHDVISCGPDTELQRVASMMVEHDCGAIPVVEPKTNKVIGIVTDRDIVCRAIAKGLNPLSLRVENVFSMPIHHASPEAPLEDCVARMEELQIRRMPVVDGAGRLCGIVSQADIARSAGEHETAELVKEVSKPSEHASRAK
jgi:CBS domain-containing protein